MSVTTRQLDSLDELVRQGQLEAARRALQALPRSRLARPAAARAANLARRVELPRLALRILNPIVRGKPARAPDAAEKTEYAAALRGLGAIAEAAEILASVDAAAHPPAALQLALCHFAAWDYAAAIPGLRDYLALPELPAYARAVGEVNLLAALVHEDAHDEAAALSARLAGSLEGPERALLRQRTLELEAQLEIGRARWDAVLACLDRAEALIDRGARDSVYALFVAKWRAIARSSRAGRVLPDLAETRARAAARGHWETVRDCDFYVGAIGGDPALLLQVWFGTPYESYRRKLRPRIAELPELYRWGDPAGRVLGLVSGLLEGQPAVKAADSPHRLLIALARDFYRPAPILSLHSALYPGEHFDPLTSPNRIHHLAGRLRACIARAGATLQVLETAGEYRLRMTGPIALEVPREMPPLAPRALELHLLLARVPRGGFTMRDAMAATGASRSTLQRLLQWALAEGRLRRAGASHHATYHATP